MITLRGITNKLRDILKPDDRCEHSSYEEKIEAAKRMRRVHVRLAELEAEAMAGKLPRKRNE